MTWKIPVEELRKLEGLQVVKPQDIEWCENCGAIGRVNHESETETLFECDECALLWKVENGL